MLSRVADSVYWMNRYIERAENIARFLDVTHQLALDLPPGRHEPWGAVIDATGDLDLFRASAGGGKFDADTVTRFLCFDAAYPSSIVSCVQRARDNARQIREVISSETWEQVNRFHFLLADEVDRDSIAHAPHAFLSMVKLASQQFVGIADGTMTHNEAWHFGQLGRSLERADKTSRILDVMTLLVHSDHLAHEQLQVAGLQAQTLGTMTQAQGFGAQMQAMRERKAHSEDELQWAALLKSASAFEMYRKRHGALEGANVIDFLLFDADFPRSVRFCASLMASSVAAITERSGAEGSMAELRVGELLAQLGMARSRDLARDLHACLDDIQAALNHAGGGVQETFFDLSPPSDSPSSVLIEG
jgi:uncharacterized alpha-E superfamily protein